MTENQNKEQLKPTKEKTYNLKNDVIFQTFFARKGNEEFLIDFLNGLLKKDIKSIEIREEVNLEKHREYEVLTGIKWYFIELPKFRKQNPDMNEKINQWLAFIDDYDREMVKVAEEKNDKLKSIIEMKLTKNEDGTITYKRNVVNRVWNDKMYLFPIPQSERMKNPNLSQNAGW